MLQWQWVATIVSNPLGASLSIGVRLSTHRRLASSRLTSHTNAEARAARMHAARARGGRVDCDRRARRRRSKPR
jgi:hypothetical protein